MPSVTTPARTVATQDSSVAGIAPTNIDSTGYRQVHTIAFIVAAQSRASILVTVVELFPELVPSKTVAWMRTLAQTPC